MNKSAISIEKILKLLPDKINLYDTGDCNLNDCDEILQSCLEEWKLDNLYLETSNWFTADYHYYLDELKNKIIKEFGVDDITANKEIEEYKEEIKSRLDELDTSDRIQDLLNNSIVWLRIDLMCNHEGIQPFYYEDVSEYSGGEKLVLRALRINPFEYKKLLNSIGRKTFGRYPITKEEPMVNAINLLREKREIFNLSKLCCLVQIGGNEFSNFLNTKTLSLKKGTKFGLFDWMNGSGSFFNIVLEKDWEFNLEKENKRLVDLGFHKEYDRFRIAIEGTFGYSIADVYGDNEFCLNKL